MNVDIKKHIIPRLIEFHIVGITIDTLLLKLTMRKSEAEGKAKIQRINNLIQYLDLKIKGIYNNHFNENMNSLTTSMAAHRIIMTYLMYYLFQAYKVGEDNELGEFLTEIERKVLREEVIFRNYTEIVLMKEDLSDYNSRCQCRTFNDGTYIYYNNLHTIGMQ